MQNNSNKTRLLISTEYDEAIDTITATVVAPDLDTNLDNHKLAELRFYCSDAEIAINNSMIDLETIPLLPNVVNQFDFIAKIIQILIALSTDESVIVMHLEVTAEVFI